MKERPILFSAPMVRAILEGRKSQTRRVVKPQPSFDRRGVTTAQWAERAGIWHFPHAAPEMKVRCPYGAPGDRLWLRETHSIFDAHGQHRADGMRWGPWAGLPNTVSPDGTKIAYYREGFDRSDPGRWRSPIHMPRWASRILLEVTDVRVERLQDISEADAIAEGVDPAGPVGYIPASDAMGRARYQYANLWDDINGAGSWAANPWVWVVSFRRVTP